MITQQEKIVISGVIVLVLISFFIGVECGKQTEIQVQDYYAAYLKNYTTCQQLLNPTYATSTKYMDEKIRGVLNATS